MCARGVYGDSFDCSMDYARSPQLNFSTMFLLVSVRLSLIDSSVKYNDDDYDEKQKRTNDGKKTYTSDNNNTQPNKLGSNVLTWSNPACNVLVGENSEITAAKSTVPETNDKSTANRAKPSISSTSSPSSAVAGNPAANGNNGAGDISSQTTGSTSSIGGNLNIVSDNILRRRHLGRRRSSSSIDVALNNLHEIDEENKMMMMMMSINGQNENNMKHSTKMMTKLNEQSVHEISANGKHFNLETVETVKETFRLSGKDAEMRIFTPNNRNSVNGQLEQSAIVAKSVLKRKRRNTVAAAAAIAVVNDETAEIEGSGFDNSNVPFDGYTVSYEKEEDIENGGNSWDSPFPLTINNARYQFDDSDTDDETTDVVENQHRKFDVSNLMLDENESVKMVVAAAAAASAADMQATTTKLENGPFTSDLYVTNVDGNENGNSLDSPAPNDFNESFELITDSIHETLVSENVVNDSHHEKANDIIQTSSQMPSVLKLDRDYLNWTSSDNLTPQPLITTDENGKNDSGDANAMKFDDTFDDKINHKPEVNDATLQNDSPAIIVQYDKQPNLNLEINNLDTTTDFIEVDEHTTNAKKHAKQQQHNTVTANTNSNINVDMNANVNDNGSILNAKHETIQTDSAPPPPLHSSENSIDGNAYVETMSGTKYQEPRYGMLDKMHNDSIKAKDVAPNMQRILVNVSIGTDSGDGTLNHGIYMLHVSVPAGPNLKPAYFDGDPPQTAIHEPPIFVKPTPHRISNENDNDKAASVAPQTVKQQQQPPSPPLPVERDPAECGSLTRKSAELILECSNEISRLNSIIANLNKTMKCTNSFEPSASSLNPPLTPTTSSPSAAVALPSSSSQSNDSLIATKAEGNDENENVYAETLTKTNTTATTVSDYKGNDNRINNNNFGLCNQDIPSILILEGKRFAYNQTLSNTSIYTHIPHVIIVSTSWKKKQKKI